ncbi:hypothetical protein [Planobispora longispora]|uniref:Uncharacterized protein n=1 Tax=Planobispora longispora TaxID=28887 RepID=A0A8J3W8C4_9ACTN|nr:hypothetical protein [Planobispora longispora]GIH80494.1 hypothetical protein Plo01_69230 [Planobispora longispora]
MNQTRKMWASAGIVAAIIVGGVSVSAAASAGRLEKDGEPVPAVEPNEPAARDQTPPAAPPSPEETPTTEDFVVSKDVNPDPEDVTRYWTDNRMGRAEPMPLPEGPTNVTED